MKNTKVIILIVAVVTILALFKGLPQALLSTVIPPSPTPSQSGQEPRVVATNPSNLDYAVILPTQTVEITFNLPIENEGEFKNSLEPKVDYIIKLSEDRKTAKIVPVTPFTLGTTFTLFIKPDTKFDGHKTLGHDIYYHFQTVAYKGV